MKKKSKGSWWSNNHRRYKYLDKKRGFAFDLSLEQSKAIMTTPCYYCGFGPSKGIDRKDSSKGHELSNIVSCCKVCNMILSTLPWEAKIELREGLKTIKEKNLLENWKPPCLLPYKEKEKKEELPNEP